MRSTVERKHQGQDAVSGEDAITHTGPDAAGPNWRHVAAFLGLTFGLTWLLNLGMYLRGGLAAPGMLTVLQFQMLLPATSAILLGLLFFRESPIYRGRPGRRPRWFYYYFLALALVFAIGASAAWLVPGQGALTVAASAVPVGLSFLGLVILVVLRLTAGREAMASVWLAGGKPRYWLLFGLAFMAWYAIQAALNAAFRLSAGPAAAPPAPPGMNPTLLLIAGAVQTVIVGPILGIVITFGEEYGWRGYLQSELFKLGRVRGVLLLGAIWGVWHWPVILMGYNYPGHPALGVVLMTLGTTVLGVILSYAVLKSGSVLLSAYLHALNNQVLAFIAFLGLGAADPAFGFGIGIYAVAMLAVVALVVLCDPVWRGKGGGLP